MGMTETYNAMANRTTGYTVVETDWDYLTGNMAYFKELTDYFLTGWHPGTTWVYVSASSFKITGTNLTSVFTKGTKIKMTNTTAKYFVVASSSFSTDTTVNVTGGSDYALADAAITAPYYSYADNPQGWPGWFNYAPASIVGWTATPTYYSKFRADGNMLTFVFRVNPASASNSTSTTVSAPVAAAAAGIDSWGGVITTLVDSGTPAATGVATLDASASTVVCYKSALAAWTASGNKAISFVIVYEF